MLSRLISRPYLDSQYCVYIVLAPFVLIFFYSVFLWADVTHDISRELLAENSVVELGTFVALLFASVTALRLCSSCFKADYMFHVPAFYAVFSFGLFFVAMEEIAWGQWFIGFQTPAAFAAKNAQGELTLHNLNLWHDYIEALPLIFGVSGLIGIALSVIPLFRPISPSVLLTTWFGMIVAFSTVDLFHEFRATSPALFDYVNHLDELIELMVGLSAVLYIWLNSRKFVLLKEGSD